MCGRRACLYILQCATICTVVSSMTERRASHQGSTSAQTITNTRTIIHARTHTHPCTNRVHKHERTHTRTHPQTHSHTHTHTHTHIYLFIYSTKVTGARIVQGQPVQPSSILDPDIQIYYTILLQTTNHKPHVTNNTHCLYMYIRVYTNPMWPNL